MNKLKTNLLTAFKGFCIGASMLVPGVSGGSMAMILGIYDRLISSVSTFFKDIKKNILFLGVFVVGAGLGFVVGAKPIGYLLETFPVPTSLFFIGTIAGGVPLIIKKSEIRKKFSFVPIFWAAVGAAIVVLISLIPSGLLDGSTGGIGSFFVSLVAGLFISVALILPGISTSHMLKVLGLYDKAISAINTLDIAFFIPLGIGAVLGIFLTTGLLEKAMKKFPNQTYMIILGFILTSMIELFNELVPAAQFNFTLLIGVVTLFIGFFAIYGLSRFDTE